MPSGTTSEMTFKNKKSNKRFGIIFVAVTLVVIAAGAWIYYNRLGGRQQLKQIVSPQPERLFTPTASDSLRKKQGGYEFGRPVESLVDEADFSGNGTGKGGKAGQGGQSVKQRVKAVRAKYHKLQDVYASYKRKPTPELAKQGQQLKDEVNSELDDLMPMAEQYDYQEGIDEGNEMRRNMQSMNFSM